MGKKDRDEWIVKCPKCGRIRESCRHVSRDDVRRIIRLLDAGVEVYQAEDEREPAESHIHQPPRPVAQIVAPQFTMGDLVLAEPTREGLLAKMESYPGVVVLATNLAKVMDRALDRRVDIAVEFPIPDADLREKIYARLVPKEAPLGKDVDFETLAKKYVMSGGSILNVVRQAMRASLRPGQRHRITMADLTPAAEGENDKAN